MAVPERIGKYPILEVLGQGAMGVVYKGFDPHIHRPVAIKTIHKNLLGDTAAHDSIAARFRNEAQAVGRIAHPGVVAIYEFGEDETTAYIAMEFVEGRNLAEVLAGTPLLPEAQLLHIMDQLLDALSSAHAQGVWHRDIKPANLILTTAGQVKLTDFGIARIENIGLTQVASTIGTPGYMAPEQYVGEGVDQRADIFACGVLLYRLLTGQPAFSGGAEVVMYKIFNEQPPAPSLATQGQRPAAYDAVVERAMAKQAAQRYPSAQAMRQALLDITSGVMSDHNNDATIIVPPAYWARTVEAAAPGPTISGSSAATAPTGWDQQALSRIERALASHVGPMARLMVREAARSCTDVQSLASAVSLHIPEDARRQQFLSVATAGSQVASGTGAVPSQARPAATGGATGSRPAAIAAIALSEDFKTRATQVLTRQLGPIARVVTKRAAERSGGDKARFIQLLLDEVAEGERSALQGELGALG